VTILESIESGDDGVDGDRYFSNLVEIVAGENANVQFGSLQNLDDDSYTYSLKRGVTDTYATVDWIESNFGSKLTRSDVETELNGDGSESQIVGTFFGTEDQHFDINARVWHQAEHTTADLVTRGVLDDVSPPSTRGSGCRRGRVEHLQLPAREHADAVGRRRGRRVAEADHPQPRHRGVPLRDRDRRTGRRRGPVLPRESNDRPADGPKHARRGLLRARV